MTVLKTGVSPSRVIHTGVTCVVPSSHTTPSMPSAFVPKRAFALSLIALGRTLSGGTRSSWSAGIPEEIALRGHHAGTSARVGAVDGQAAQHRARPPAVRPDHELRRCRDLVGHVHLGSLQHTP